MWSNQMCATHGQEVNGSDMHLAGCIGAGSTWLVIGETIFGTSRQVAEIHKRIMEIIRYGVTAPGLC